MNTAALHWSIASHLAHACGVDWGRWAIGLTAPCRCAPYRGDHGLGSRLYHSSECPTEEAARERGNRYGVCEVTYRLRRAIPIQAPENIHDTHEAYREDCRRRHVEPGQMPAWAWVHEGIVVRMSANLRALGVYIRLKEQVAELAMPSPPGMSWGIHGRSDAKDLRRLLDLIDAVERGRKAAT